MHRAAGVATVKLVCHQDLWDQLDLWQISSGHRPAEWVAPEYVRRISHDMVEVPLSGLNVAALLRITRRHRLMTDARHPELHAVAGSVYDRIAAAIDAVEDTDSEGLLPPIVLEDEFSPVA